MKRCALIKIAVIVTFTLLSFNFVLAEEFNFNDLKPVYDHYYNFLVNCNNNPSLPECTEEAIYTSQKNITVIFYDKSVRFYNHNLFSYAKEYAKKCVNLSESINFSEYKSKCNDLLGSIEYFEFDKFANESDCGGIMNQNIIWSYNNSVSQNSPSDSYLDLTEDFDKYSTIVNNININLDENNKINFYISLKDNREYNDSVFCNKEIAKGYLFVTDLEQALVTADSSELPKRRFLICFDSDPYLCTYSIFRLQYDLPLEIKSIGGYGYELKDQNYVIEKDFKQIKNSFFYPFINYETQIVLFFPSKKQVFNQFQLCGNKDFNIVSSSINLINPLIFNRTLNNFYLPEKVDNVQINSTLDILKSSKNNCFSYYNPSNLEGITVNGYSIYLIRSVYKQNADNFSTYIIYFLIASLITILVPLFVHYLFSVKLHVISSKEIINQLIAGITTLGIFLFLVPNSIEIIKDSPVFYSLGNIIVILSWVLIILFSIGIVLFIDKSNKKLKNMICSDCNHTWAKKKLNPTSCPICRSDNIKELNPSN